MQTAYAGRSDSWHGFHSAATMADSGSWDCNENDAGSDVYTASAMARQCCVCARKLASFAISSLGFPGTLGGDFSVTYKTFSPPNTFYEVISLLNQLANALVVCKCVYAVGP